MGKKKERKKGGSKSFHRRKVNSLTFPELQNYFKVFTPARSGVEMDPLHMQFEETFFTTSISIGTDNFLFDFLTGEPKFIL